ncbi:asparagine synthase (glutamine-hydrolyzing) [Zobellia galactanivorans]|uniref:asparagine synthase (glutamine-hydrolyzing) n=1 Tax=Zobellia galactanivorans (strain DSM 12802 / CCUG 47099 / CIP 106680 / NCIMB 13871 / Dsij) TaxID=63186 RepID=G0L830_ZOBGA|nr:asparagine synthase (glutamine-hydrolyzing) [Zobellia galactanivorans]CAZ97899.1 Asparagine synthase B [Zobellia galactanivorans]
MCGIYGTTIPYKEQEVREKLKRTSFRGPDQMGLKTYQSILGKITFGHNRLSIIDLDSRSNQPLEYAKNIHIVFNGEIYNFKEIREILKKKGHSFSTTSDTEVICAAYLEYGEECVKHFNGMFAFVIFDATKQLLFGAKDRMGQKPFYYYLNGKDFEFSSQISSIALFNTNLTISRNSIQEYLAWSSVPSPHSIFNEIKKLEDGHSFTFDLQNGVFKEKQYWDIDYLNPPNYKGSFLSAQDHLEELLSDATRIRLFADVPVGVFLSGGVDSSLIAALATKSTSKKIKTFCVRFNEKGFNESHYAQQVADHLDTEHEVIDCDYKEGIDLLDNFSFYYDEPFADASAVPSMLLAKHTKKQVTVALSGDGGDEGFLGYHRYNWIDKINIFMKFPYPIRKQMTKLITSVPNYRFKVAANVIDSKDIEEAYLKTVFSPDQSWMSTPNSNPEFEELKYLMHNNKNIYERAANFDIKTYLNWDINQKVDRASMAYSLETRSPFLDYRIMEFAQTLPTSFKYKSGNQKRILKEILYKHVPKSIFDRPKAGFAMPFKVWFREDLKEFVLDQLSLENLNSIPGIKPEVISSMIESHMNGSWNHYPLIWKLLVLKQWLDKNGKGFSIQ